MVDVALPARNLQSRQSPQVIRPYEGATRSTGALMVLAVMPGLDKWSRSRWIQCRLGPAGKLPMDGRDITWPRQESSVTVWVTAPTGPVRGLFCRRP